MIISKSENKTNIFKNLFPKLLIILPIGILGNIAFSLYTSKNTILVSLSEFSVGFFSLAVLLTIIPWFTHALRILIWSRFLKKDISFLKSFEIVLGTEIGAGISPTSVGGAPIKIGMLSQQPGVSTGVATSLTLLGSFEDNLFVIFAIPIALTYSMSWKLPIFKQMVSKFYPKILWFCLGVLILGIILVVIRKVFGKSIGKIKIRKFTFSQKMKHAFRSFWSDFQSVYYLIIKKGKSRFILSMALTTLQWICRYSVISALLASLNISVEPVRFFALQWVVFTLMNFVPTPGATAGAEAAFYFIYESFFPSHIIGLITIGWRFLTFYFLLILATLLLVLFNLPHQNLKKIFKPSSIPYVSMSFDQ